MINISMGECSVDTEKLIINEEDFEQAQVICSSISDIDKRNRAVANVIGAKIAVKFFSDDKYSVDESTGLHNIPSILESFDISDIYINSSYIDVRVYFSEDELSVPKKHFDLDIKPEAYMFIKLNSDLSSAAVTGFLRPDYINTDNLKDEYYYINEEDLSSFYDIEAYLKNKLELFSDDNKNIYKLLENSLNEDEVIELLKDLILSQKARISLLQAVKAQSVFNLISTPQEAVEQVLNEETEVVPVEETPSDNDDFESLMETEIDAPIDENSEESLLNALEYSTEVTPNIESSDEQTSEGIQVPDNEEQIDALFTGEQQGIPAKQKKKSNGFLSLVLILTLICGGGYWWYTNIYNANNELPSQLESSEDINSISSEDNNEVLPPEKTEEAMPNETVNDSKTPVQNNEAANSVSIPAIEQNLDASVLVSNLKVDWEVPEGYASNTSAKRYLIKLGKIVQLNLKSDLLLLNKPPIANRITVELRFNPNISKFEVVGIQSSSGEKNVDETILDTIKAALKMSLSSNTESFGHLQGNPILVIKL